MAFHVGQKVVCILDYGKPEMPGDVIWPEKNKIYTIRTLLAIGREPSLRVSEIKNAPHLYSNISVPIEPAFVVYAFRPLIENKTDISIFTKMLTGKRRSVDA